MQQDPDLIARSAEELVGDLNPQQAEAVQYRGPALLIGAGAGSGKTRVLTRRIAWILAIRSMAEPDPRHHLHQQGGR